MIISYSPVYMALSLCFWCFKVGGNSDDSVWLESQAIQLQSILITTLAGKDNILRNNLESHSPREWMVFTLSLAPNLKLNIFQRKSNTFLLHEIDIFVRCKLCKWPKTMPLMNNDFISWLEQNVAKTILLDWHNVGRRLLVADKEARTCLILVEMNVK